MLFTLRIHIHLFKYSFCYGLLIGTWDEIFFWPLLFLLFLIALKYCLGIASIWLSDGPVYTWSRLVEGQFLSKYADLFNERRQCRRARNAD